MNTTIIVKTCYLFIIFTMIIHYLIIILNIHRLVNTHRIIIN